MKVFIIGVAGATGFRLAARLRASGDEVGGLCRRRSQRDSLRAIGVTATTDDLVVMSVPRLSDALRGSEVIVFTAGAGDADNESVVDAVDGDGVTKSIAAAEAAGVRRFILVSVFPEAGRGGQADRSFEHYIRVKKRADVELSRSELEWVILRPSTLTDEIGVGTVDLGPAQIHTTVTRDDVAATLAELIHTPSIRHRILELTSGAVSIPRAVSIQAEQSSEDVTSPKGAHLA